MTYFNINNEKHIKCSCGRVLPQRWFKEGKMTLKPLNKESSRIESCCVSCANDDEYKILLNKFASFLRRT